MAQAVRLYDGMGFQKCNDLDLDDGVPWAIYCKEL